MAVITTFAHKLRFVLRPRFNLAACAAAAVVAALALVSPLPMWAQTYDASAGAGSPAWQRIRLDGFTVIGTASATALRQVADGLAAFRSALVTHSPHLRADGPLPTFVVVLENFGAYTRYQPRDHRGRRVESVASYLNVSAEANHLVLPYIRGDLGRSLIFHEYTHYVIRQSVNTPVPLWVEEGLAEFYATFRPEYGAGSLLGAAQPERVLTLRQQPYVQLRDLLSPRNGGQLLRSTRSDVFYAQSWALVHYIMMERKNPVPSPLDAYMATLAATDSQDRAFRAAFGVEVDGMDRELRRYVRQYSFRTRAIPRPMVSRTEVVEPVADTEARQLETTLLDVREVPEEFQREDLAPF